MNQQDQRDELLDQAKYGKISGLQADAEAIRLGLGSLSRHPNHDEFRPEDLTHWTLPMAVAWIAYLDFEVVREWSAPYCAECYDWLWQRWRVGFDGSIHEGWHLEQRRRPTLSILAISAGLDGAEDGKAPVMSVKEAQNALWLALREGLVTASGIDLETQRRVEIAALDWHELIAVEGRGEIDEVRRGLMGSGYRELLLPSGALRSLWQPVAMKPLNLPQSMPPTGDGFMPLYSAAQWIATKGATIEFDPEDEAFWRVAYDELLSAIASEKVRVVGTRDGQREIVPGFHFAGCEVEYPFGAAELTFLTGDDLYLCSHPYLDEEHWRGGIDDALMSRGQKRWSRIMVDKGDVRSCWPFDITESDQFVELRSGLPGRPTKSKHLLENEFRRRATAGELADTLTLEAETLLSWLRITHPDYPPPTVRTIKNNIRSEYRLSKCTK